MSEPAAEYSCTSVARWLPRVLAGAILTAAMLAGYRVSAAAVDGLGRGIGRAVMLAGAAVAIWVVRGGSELALSVRVEDDAIAWTRKDRAHRLALQELDGIVFAPPFAITRTWLPATIVRDRFGHAWRISALLRHGDRAIAEILRRAGRDDLATWADARGIVGRMARAGLWTAVGYGLAGMTLLAGVVFYFR